MTTDAPASMEYAPFAQIWDRLPERHGRLSSVWWFFLLFPRGGRGYGPKQIMFTFGARAGAYRVDGRAVPGMPPRVDPEAVGVPERFPAFALGWMHDGERLHERLLHDVCRAELDPAGRLTASIEGADAAAPAVSLTPLPERPLGLRARFEGARGGGVFDAWGDPAALVTRPVVSIDRPGRLTGGHAVGWERLSFEGRFRTPAGEDELEGVGFFQRVCARAPWMPWKWMYVVFEDRSVFSCFMPYFGANLLRRSTDVYPQAVERLAVEPLRMGMFSDGATGEAVRFDRVRAVPVVVGREVVGFDVRARSAAGDVVAFEGAPVERTGYTLSRALLGGRLNTRYVYNEYLLRVDGVVGEVGGRTLDGLGTGYGNFEYNWGFSP